MYLIYKEIRDRLFKRQAIHVQVEEKKRLVEGEANNKLEFEVQCLGVDGGEILDRGVKVGKGSVVGYWE